ncbi:3,4-dihydroxy-2-butanone kinase [Raphidocelis subcapitata]|uniref:3,4-dihydroxy-2-butanone kinase n=1 Tax=Raphidocelis subcapitata TaxID=307507 RepID=A0A2V0PJT7_9CHLO|nr:3,4-dihydroxy-2-butanone kinase [Raphidocelis subcapitata]|eukprot:GBF98253.1 3,4-dihydroxy-2-butanone kinase [Raphidocelis subcapitata]
MQQLLWAHASRRLVQDSLDGLVASVPHLRRIDAFPEIKVVVNADHAPSRVAVISGGGSGHEPAHAGFVGMGMLAAAVCGEVFASPSAEAVQTAIEAVAPSDVLLIVKNYSGDRIHFGLAAEAAKASGRRVALAVVDDDVAIETPGLAGRRGIAGTMLVHKVAGAAAADGASLDEVADAVRRAAASVATLGVAVAHAGPTPHAIELGLGIHGEPGFEKGQPAPLEELVPRMLRRVLGYRGAAHAALNSGAPLALLVNNLGGMSNLELAAVTHEALGWLRNQAHNVSRVYTGACVTSLDMSGFSLSLMSLDEARTRALDAPTAAPGWPTICGPVEPLESRVLPLPPAIAQLRAKRAALLAGRPLASATPQGRELDAAVRAAATALLPLTQHLNELDAAAGDGDCGSTVRTAAEALLAAPEGAFAGDAAEALEAAVAVIRASVGGSLGGLYAIGLSAAAGAMARGGSAAAAGPAEWSAALRAGLESVELYGRARPGHRTLLDALVPAAEALAAAADAGAGAAEAAHAAAAAAKAGAAATAGMAASAGCASYVRGSALKNEDPGAVAAAAWLQAVADSLAGGEGR